jgi:proteic killer suppression protein
VPEPSTYFLLCIGLGAVGYARRKLRMINNSIDVSDLRIPPANRLEKLKGNLKEFNSIRINNQWRIIFKWDNGNALEVGIIDYH